MALLVGFTVGVYAGIEYSGHRHPKAASATSRSPTGETVRPQHDEARLPRAPAIEEGSDAGSRSVRESVAADKAPPAWKVLADLQQRKLATPAITFVSGSGQLTDAFASLFSLTDVERSRLQKDLDRATDQLADLQRRHATTVRGDDGTVTITIKSFAVEGGAVYDELMKGFAQTLGDERNGSFVKLGGEQVERAFGRFGAPDYVYTFKRRPNPSSGGNAYEVSERHKLPLEHGTSNSSYRSWTELQNRMGPVTRLLPPDFAVP